MSLYTCNNEFLEEITEFEARELYEQDLVRLKSKGRGSNYRITAAQYIQPREAREWKPRLSGGFNVMQMVTP